MSGYSASVSGTDVGSYTNVVTGSNNNSNYSNIVLNSGSLNIGKATAIISATKTYDSTANLSSGQISISGVNGQILSYTGTALANSANVSANGSNYVTGISLANGGSGSTAGLASNYMLPSLSAQSSNNNVTINPYAGQVTLTANSTNSVYTGSAQTVSGFIATGLLGADANNAMATMSGYAASVTATNAGTYTNSINVTQANSNYSNVSLATGTLNITKATAVISATKNYDGTSSMTPGTTGTTLSVSGINGETLNYSGPITIFDSNVIANGANYVSGITLTNGTGSHAGLASNYMVNPGYSSANNTVLINPVVATISATKVYDGTAVVVPGITGTALTITGINGQNLVYSGSVMMNDSNVNGATYISNLVLGNGSGVNAGLASNYVLPSLSSHSSNNTATITPASLTITVSNSALFVTQNVNNASNIPNQGVSYSGTYASGFAPGDSASSVFTTQPSTWTPIYVGVNAGSVPYYPLVGTYTAALGLNVTPIANNGNYNITVAKGQLSVVPAGELLITVPSVTSPIVYGTTTATNAGLLAATSSGSITAQYLTTSGTNGSVISSLNVTSQGNGNYTATDLLGVAVTFSTCASLGSCSVSLPSTSISTGGYLNVGTYTFGTTPIVPNSTPNFTGSYTNGGTFIIDPKAISVSGVTASNKIYNGDTSATISTANVNLAAAGVASGDQVTVNASGTFASKNAANGITVNWVATETGADIANYAFSNTGTTSANITPAVLTASVIAPNKTYNGNNIATPTLTITSGLIGQETIGVTGSATYNSPNVIDANTVTVNSVTLSNGTYGGLASNYTLSAGQTTTASIIPQALTAIYTASNKVYNGSTAALTNFSITGGLIGQQTIGINALASFNSANVLDANTVTVNSITLTNGSNGGLASNYSLTVPTQTQTAYITPANISISGIAASNKVYDGTTQATINTNNINYAGLIAGDQILTSATGSFVTPTVGINKPVALTLVNTGSSLSNYTITDQQFAYADITNALVVPPSNNNSQVNPVTPVIFPAQKNLTGSKIILANSNMNLSTLDQVESCNDKKVCQCESTQIIGVDICYSLNSPIKTANK